MPSQDGGLGASLVGEKFMVNQRQVHVTKLLGEGGFSYVYLVKEITDVTQGGSLSNSSHGGGSTKRSNSDSGGRSSGNGASGQSSKRSGSMGKESNSNASAKVEMVLKVTSILSRQQRDIAEKEAKLLSRLSHPSIIKMFDTCYRTVASSTKRSKEESGKTKERPQHLILMEYCEGGHALDVCNQLAARGERFDLSQLIIAFGQICNAVSYLHAQRPPIVHRDLKPANFLVKNTGYKLCDFGSAVFGHVDLKTSEARTEAEEVIQKTTTQMFRAPEMVDLYMAKKLTQATDVWALGCCLYSLAFLQNCFEEGSNLAILSRKYKIPDDNPYGDGLVELLDRMLTVDSKERADMTEVILCLSAVYSGRPLPPRKDRKSKKDEKEEAAAGSSADAKKGKKHEKAGTFRTDGQGIYQDLSLDPKDPNKQKEAKKLNPNSAAARRRAAAATSTNVDPAFSSFSSKFDEAKQQGEVNPDTAFSTDAFEAFDAIKPALERNPSSADDVFGALTTEGDDDVKNAFEPTQSWGDAKFDTSFDAFGNGASDPAPSAPTDTPAGGQAPEEARRRRPRQKSKTVRPRKEEDKVSDAVDDMNLEENGEGSDGEDTARRSRRTPTRRVRRTTSGTGTRRRGSARENKDRDP